MLAVLAFSWLLAAGPPATDVPAPFTAELFRRHVAYLASDELEGRAIGSAGAAKAMQYLIRYFQEVGLKGRAATMIGIRIFLMVPANTRSRPAMSWLSSRARAPWPARPSSSVPTMIISASIRFL